MYQGQRIYFNQDYTVETQKKHKQVRDVIKQLKEKKIKAVSPFPAQLKIYLDHGTKTFSTLAQAAQTLEELGIHIKVDEQKEIRDELTRNTWSIDASKDTTGEATLSITDLRAFV